MPENDPQHANAEAHTPTWSGPLPLRGGRALPGCLWLAPLTNLQSPDQGRLSDTERDWLLSRADGGLQVIETCAAYVHPDGQAWPGQLGVATAEQCEALRPLAEGLAARGAAGLVQLFHGGARADRALTGQPTWSLSRFEEASKGFVPPEAATEERLLAVISEQATAAARVEAVGFAGVELHAAHGYLLGQALSTVCNTREDQWGGSLENRARLLRESVRAVRAATGPGFILGVRLSPEDMGQAKGLDLDESLQVAAWLAEDGVDFIHISLWDCTKNTAKRPDQHPIPLFRAAVGEQVALVAAGAIWTAEDVDRAFALGADAVAVGKAAIGHQDWAAQLERGETPSRPPFSVEHLKQNSVSEVFINYLSKFRGFVAAG